MDIIFLFQGKIKKDNTISFEIVNELPNHFFVLFFFFLLKRELMQKAHVKIYFLFFFFGKTENNE